MKRAPEHGEIPRLPSLFRGIPLLEEREGGVDVEPGLAEVSLDVLDEGRRRDAPALRHPLRRRRRRRRHERERERGEGPSVERREKAAAAASSKPKEEGLGFCSVGPSDHVLGLGPSCNEIQGPLSAQQQSRPPAALGVTVGTCNLAYKAHHEHTRRRFFLFYI